MNDNFRSARVLLEAFVIVGSILLAFGIQAWWDNRQDEGYVRRSLQGTLAEMTAVGADLELEAPVHRARLSRVDTLRARMEAAGAGATFAIPDTLLAALFYDYVADFPSGMVESVISSGHLDKVKSDVLRRSLLSWVALLEDQRDDQTRASAFGSMELQPYLRAEFDVVRAEWADRSAAPVDRHLSTDIAVTPRLRNLIVWQRRWLDRIVRQNDALIQQRVELDSLIRAEIRLH
jgi:hypothetical protein